MKWTVLLAIPALVACGPNCKDFQSGSFKLDGPQSQDIVVERKGNIQYERSDIGGYENQFELIWLDDCTYQLVFIESTKPASISLTKEDTLTVRITGTDGDKCTSIAKMKDLEFQVNQIKINS